MVSDPKLLCKRLLSIKDQLLLIGDGVVAYERTFRRLLGNKAIIPPSGFNFPHAACLAEIAYERLKRGSSDDIVTLVPNYLRHSDAEIGFRGRTKILPQRRRGQCFREIVRW
jgi:tRNA A37 threonylcarbamoyladenosine modification protein TsaB